MRAAPGRGQRAQRGPRRNPPGNRLLDRLPPADRAQVLDGCEEVELTFAEILAEPGGPVRAAYFPMASCISLLGITDKRSLVEVALAGNEGMFGLPIVLGVDTSPVRALVQGPGTAWRIGAARFRDELARSVALRSCMGAYAHVLLSQAIQTAGCNRFHRVEQRVARWLLMTADRSNSSSFRMTQAFLAYMLGVRRVGVTRAASALAARGLIGYSRGDIEIMDRRGLERAACSCYRSDLRAYATAFH